MTTETRPVQIKPNIFDIFIGGARKGWNLATQNLVPNILMAYVIAYILNILGVMDTGWGPSWASSACRDSLSLFF